MSEGFMEEPRGCRVGEGDEQHGSTVASSTSGRWTRTANRGFPSLGQQLRCTVASERVCGGAEELKGSGVGSNGAGGGFYRLGTGLRWGLCRRAGGSPLVARAVEQRP